MLLLWCLLLLLLGIALALIILPLLFPQKKYNTQDSALLIYRQQWQELQQQFQKNEITPTDFEQSKAELEQAVLQHQTATTSKAVAVKKNNIIWIIVISLLVVIISIGLYKIVGDSQGLQQFYGQKQQQQLAKTALTEYGSVNNIIAALQKKLQQNPNSAQGWYLLGKLYLNQQQFNDATLALAKANQLKPNDVTIMETYAESAFFANNQRLPENIKPLLTKILQLNSNDINAMNLIAIDAYRGGNYSVAVHYWEKILPLVGSETDEGKTVLAMLNQAQQHLTAVLPRVNLSIQVVINAKLKPQLPADAVLFVYAKAINGPPMPLAVKRFSINTIPSIINLINDDAMLPTLRLSNFPAVKIFARISKTGQALPAADDWQVESAVINPSHQQKLIRLELK